MFQFVPVAAPVAAAARRERRDPFGNAGLAAIVVDAEASFPCRVCLQDARIGERVLLFSFAPFAGPAPHQTLGPIYIHEAPCVPFTPSPRVPEVVLRRTVALRAYDEGATRLFACEIAEGAAVLERVRSMLADPRVQRILVHNARAGCFACAVERTAP